MTTITIIAIYSGNLVAFMMVKKTKLPLDSLREQTSYPEYQAGIHGGSAQSSLFQVKCISTDKGM